jgi:hypothetical protein
MILTIAIIDDGLIHKMIKFTWLLEDKELAWKISLSLSLSLYIYIYIDIWIFFLGKKSKKKISTTEDEPLIMSLACNCCINYFRHMEKDTNKHVWMQVR